MRNPYPFHLQIIDCFSSIQHKVMDQDQLADILEKEADLFLNSTHRNETRNLTATIDAHLRESVRTKSWQVNDTIFVVTHSH